MKKVIKFVLFITVLFIMIGIFLEIHNWLLDGEDIVAKGEGRFGGALFMTFSIPWVYLAYITIRYLWKKDWEGLRFTGQLHLLFQPIFFIVTALSLNHYTIITDQNLITSGFLQLTSETRSLDQVEKVTLDYTYIEKGDDKKTYTLHFRDGSSQEIWYNAIGEENEMLKVDRLLMKKQVPKEVLDVPPDLYNRSRAVQILYSQ